MSLMAFKSRRYSLMAAFFLVFGVGLAPHQSEAAFLWKDSKPKRASQSRFNYDRSHEAREVSHFWTKRKVAVGLATAGVYGLAGGVIGIHFHPQWSVDLGYGGGSHFQSYGFRIKKLLLMSSPLNPYIGFGFHRWQRTTNRPFDAGSISPNYVAQRFMSEADQINGQIDERIAHGSLGLQYVFTDGAWAGYGLFAEMNFLVSVQDFESSPTGSLGFNYFF